MIDLENYEWMLIVMGIFFMIMFSTIHLIIPIIICIIILYLLIFLPRISSGVIGLVVYPSRYGIWIGEEYCYSLNRR